MAAGNTRSRYQKSFARTPYLKIGRRQRGFGRVGPPPLDSVKEMSHGSGYNAQLVFRYVDVEAGAHGVRLAGSCLPIRQDGGIVPFEASLDQMTNGSVVNRTLRRIQVVAKVESEGFVFTESNLYGKKSGEKWVEEAWKGRGYKEKDKKIEEGMESDEKKEKDEKEDKDEREEKDEKVPKMKCKG